jgi:hypothetical protein
LITGGANGGAYIFGGGNTGALGTCVLSGGITGGGEIAVVVVFNKGAGGTSTLGG